MRELNDRGHVPTNMPMCTTQHFCVCWSPTRAQCSRWFVIVCALLLMLLFAVNAAKYYTQTTTNTNIIRISRSIRAFGLSSGRFGVCACICAPPYSISDTPVAARTLSSLIHMYIWYIYIPTRELVWLVRTQCAQNTTRRADREIDVFNNNKNHTHTFTRANWLCGGLT